MAHHTKAKSLARSADSPSSAQTSHLRLLAFALSAVSIQGRDWIPRDPAIPGSLQVHRMGSSIFIRLVGLIPEGDIEDEDTQQAYAPTFNVQEELIRFHHSPQKQKPWRAILTVLSTRDTPDIQRFRTAAGAAMVHCLVASESLSQALDEKLQLVIDTCVPKGDVLSVSADSAIEIYKRLLSQQIQVPSAIGFSFTKRDGSAVERDLSSEDLNLAEGVPIGRPLMDLMFEILVCQGPAQIEFSPSLPCDVDMVCGWMAIHPPPDIWRGLRLIPLHAHERWSILVAKYCGPGTDLNLVILDPLSPSPHVGPTGIQELAQPIGSQRVFFHPTVFGSSNAPPRRSGYSVLDYLFCILARASDGGWKIPDPAGWQSDMEFWEYRGVQGVRLEIAKTLMMVQKVEPDETASDNSS